MINIRIYRGFFDTNGFFGSPELYKILILYNIFNFSDDNFCFQVAGYCVLHPVPRGFI